MKLSATQIKAVVKVQQAYGILGSFPSKKSYLDSGVNGHTLTSLIESELLGLKPYRGVQVVFIQKKGMTFLSAWESVIIEAANANKITKESLNDDRIIERLGREVIKRLAS
jgi:hypothetical protein